MNWHKRIAAARKRGRFTGDDEQLAGDWVTCACGEQDQRIPRHQVSCPKDAYLGRLGCSFSDAVKMNDYDGADRLLAAIERRAAEVLEEVAK